MKKTFILLLAVLLAVTACAGSFAKQRKLSAPSYQLAMDKLSQNNMQGALIELKKAHKANPSDPEVYYGFALTYRQWNRPAEALPYADKAIEYAHNLETEHPGMKSEAYNLKGDILIRLNKNEEALKCFNKALEDDVYRTPEYTLYNMSIVYIMMGNYTDARNSLLKAVKFRPDYAPAWDALGVLYSKTGDNGAAINALNRALIVYPDYVEAHWDIAQIYIETGDTENARKHLLDVMRLDKTGGFAVQAKQKLDEIGEVQ